MNILTILATLKKALDFKASWERFKKWQKEKDQAKTGLVILLALSLGACGTKAAKDILKDLEDAKEFCRLYPHEEICEVVNHLPGTKPTPRPSATSVVTPEPTPAETPTPEPTTAPTQTPTPTAKPIVHPKVAFFGNGPHGGAMTIRLIRFDDGVVRRAIYWDTTLKLCKAHNNCGTHGPCEPGKALWDNTCNQRDYDSQCGPKHIKAWIKGTNVQLNVKREACSYQAYVEAPLNTTITVESCPEIPYVTKDGIQLLVNGTGCKVWDVPITK